MTQKQDFDKYVRDYRLEIQSMAKRLREVEPDEYPLWLQRWITSEINRMRSWLERKVKASPEYKISNPGGFIERWLREEADKLTEQDEEEQRRATQETRGSSKGFTVAEIMGQAQERTK